jgi:hypothetical protein
MIINYTFGNGWNTLPASAAGVCKAVRQKDFAPLPGRLRSGARQMAVRFWLCSGTLKRPNANNRFQESIV